MTMTKAEIIAAVVDAVGVQHNQAKQWVEAFFDTIQTQLSNGHNIKISGFGNFELKEKPARPGRNPKTGEEVTISARRVVTFKAGQKLRDRLNKLA